MGLVPSACSSWRPAKAAAPSTRFRRKDSWSTVAISGVPRGGDIGVESVGFVPATGASAAYLADRGTPRSGKPHPGTDSILRSPTRLHYLRRSPNPGDLLVATEGAATVVHVQCGGRCMTTVAATGPAPAHGEGHLLITGSP